MRKLLKKAGGILIVSALLCDLTGCGQSPIRNPLGGNNEPKLGALPATEKKNPRLAKVMWSSGALGKPQRFAKLNPYVNGPVVYAADHSGKIIALDRHSGKKIWTVSTGEKFTAGPTLVNGSLLLATSDAKIISYAADSGTQMWEAKVTSEVLAPPSGSQGMVLVHAIDGSISALDAKNGEVRWRVDQSAPSLTLRFSSTPIIAGDKVLVGSAAGKLLALNIQSGLIEWERNITQPRGRSELQRMVDITADPLVKGDVAYVVTYQGKLAAVNVNSGNLLWERDVSSYQNMAIDNHHLYITDNTHTLWAIDRQNGSTLWKQAALGERYITGPAVVDNKVVVADRGGYLHFLSAKDGHVLSNLSVSGKFYQNPQTVGHEIIVNMHNGKLAAIAYSGQG
jgi:outer membrane protein assembly factor BamB